MAAQRLSKLQKWILEHCFRVTILLDRALLKPLKNCQNYSKCQSCDMRSMAFLERNSNNDMVAGCKESGEACRRCCFYKEDILQNYFQLTPNYTKHGFSRVIHFHDSPGYSKAHVTLFRSLTNLKEKELIYTWRFEDESLQINLTDKGIKIAAELIGINDYFLPTPLTDEECEAIRQKSKREYSMAIAAIKAQVNP